MRARAVILAGGEGNRLGVLTAKRAKPAVPFAGKYRLIDFTLSNCVNSGIFDVMVLTQYRPHSLNDHIGAGQPWDLDRTFTGGVKVYQPYKGRADTDWYAGTADAIQQNFSFLKHGSPDFALVLSGDHIYQMNYDDLLDFHIAKGADLTVAVIDVPPDEARRMGILGVNEDFRVTSFTEKPHNPPGTMASMGVYVFTLPVLDQLLMEDSKRRDSSHDFGKDIIPRMIEAGQPVFAYHFAGYWMDVGTIDAYWRAHMDLLQSPSPINLHDRSWVIHTRSAEMPPAWLEDGAVVKNSLVCDGAMIEAGALVEHSVLSPGVFIGRDAAVRDSILLTRARVEAGATVERTILDKYGHIGKNARVGSMVERKAGPCITAIGKNVSIPDRFRVPCGVSIGADVPEEQLLKAAPLKKNMAIERGKR